MRTNKGQTSQVASIPSPTGGLNGRDNITNMAPTDAVIMENWFPESSGISPRGGSALHNTIGNPSTGPAVKTLAVYNGSAATSVFAASDTSIYDVTVVNTFLFPPIVVAGLTSSIFQWCQMGTIGGRFLMMFNGVDDPRYYNGTTWSATSMGGGATQISGVNPNVIINCNIYKNRLYLIEKNSANVWYLPVNSVYGAATKLDLSSIFKQGSTVIAMATWSIDSSGGPQEYAVFISNFGEIVTYSGSDPSVATDFKIASNFIIGKPVGYRCFAQLGSDVVVLCADGAFPLSQALLTDRTQTNLAVTDKIRNLITNDIAAWVAAGSPNPERWQILLFANASKLIINVAPVTGSAYQYVMNTNTGAWTKFTGWDAYCFAVFGEELLYGRVTRVIEADIPLTTDTTGSIVCDCQQAFQTFGTPAQKNFVATRAIIKTNGGNTGYVTLDVDYYNSQEFPDTSSTGNVVTVNSVTSGWKNITNIGFSAAPRIVTNAEGNGVTYEWLSTDIMYKTGGLI